MKKNIKTNLLNQKATKKRLSLISCTIAITEFHGGKTLATILNVLRNDLGYFAPEPQIINAEDFGVP